MGGATQYMTGRELMNALTVEPNLRGVLSLRDIQALRARNAERQRATLEDMRARGVSVLCDKVEKKP